MITALIIIAICSSVVVCVYTINIFSRKQTAQTEKHKLIDAKVELFKKISEMSNADNHDYFNDLFNKYGRDYQITEDGTVTFSDDYFTLDEIADFYDYINNERMND